MRLGALLAALLFTNWACGQSPAGYQISGTVVDRVTHAALPGIIVQIIPAEPNGQVEQSDQGDTGLAITTDGAGRFSFEHLGSRKFVLTARRGDEQPESYKQHGPYSTAIVTGPGLDTEHVVFPFQYGGARLSGSVMSDDGEPVAQAAVYLLVEGGTFGKHRVIIRTQTQTSGSGKFRFNRLRPGTYYLAVVARPWYARDSFSSVQAEDGTTVNVRSTSPILDESYPVTYSGNTTDGRSAQPITISEAGSATADFTLHAVPAIHIDMPASERRTPSSVPGHAGGHWMQYVQGQMFSQPQLMSVGPGDVGVPVPANVMSQRGPEGRLLVTIAPGTYRIRMESGESSGRSAISEAVLTLTSDGPISLPQKSASVVSGRVFFAQGLPGGGTRFVVAAGESGQTGGPIQADGTFALPNPLPAGRYQLMIPGESIRSVKVNELASAGSYLVVPDPAPGSLAVAITTGPNSMSVVSGHVMLDGKPVEAAMVLLLPLRSADEFSIVRDQSDSDGSFALANVAAGEYRLLALDAGDAEVPYTEREAINSCLADAQIVRIPAQSKGQFVVPVTAWPCRAKRAKTTGELSGP